MKTLCIDIGGTRIKSVILPRNPDFETAKNARPQAIRTLGWLNHSLPGLVNPENWAGLAARFKQQDEEYDRVAIDLPAYINHDGKILDRDDLVNGDAQLPRDIKLLLEAAAKKPVTVLNDAEAWMYGIASYAELTGISLDWPVMALIFGTGLGVAGGRDPRTLTVFNPMEQSWVGTACEKVAGISLDQPWKVHQVVGKDFTSWIGRDRRGWTYDEIRTQFTQRVAAVIEGMSSIVSNRIGQIRTIVVGGGNAEFVSVSKLSKRIGVSVITLSERNAKLSPDLTPLLGLENAAHWHG